MVEGRGVNLNRIKRINGEFFKNSVFSVASCKEVAKDQGEVFVTRHLTLDPRL